MADLNETVAAVDEFDAWVQGIYQLEQEDLVLGGADGIDNLQAKQLLARSNWLKAQVLGLGAGKQPLDAMLTALSALVTDADQTLYFTGPDAPALTALTAYARTLIAAADAAAARATLGAASPADIAAAISALVNSSPATLDTLNELAAALGNDANFATTITNALALKAPLASPALTGVPTAPTADPGTNTDQVATTAFVQASMSGINALPFSALSYPTVDNANGYPIINAAIVGGTGGNVTITAGTRFALAETASAGLGVMRSFTTAAWTSPNLDANSTYYLRCQVQGSVAVFYVQKGTDSDAIPGSLLGTPNGLNGGGFDSTRLDMLCAKLVTGANGTAPTVTPLSNAARLAYKGSQNATETTASGGWINHTYSYTLNWARTPKAIFTVGTHGVGPSGQALDQIYSSSETVTRYTASHIATIDWQNDAAFSVTSYSTVLATA